MTNKTKELYRNKIQEISKKTKISEIYIARKILEISNKKEKGEKQSHIGYYLIDKGINELYNTLNYKTNKQIDERNKAKSFILGVTILSVIISLGITYLLNINIKNNWIYIIGFILFFIPATEVSVQIIQYILSKFVKPKMIPKMDFAMV